MFLSRRIVFGLASQSFRRYTASRTAKQISATQPNMFTEFASEWGLNDQQIGDAQALALKDGIDGSQKPSKLLLFLYAKGILSNQKSSKRIAEFDEILAAETENYESALRRLRTIVEVGESSPTRTTLFQDIQKSFFDAFVESHPEWAAGDDVFVAHRDHRDLQGKEHALVERFQKSGLCYMHAPVVLQHYLVAMSNSESTPMLNIAEFLKKKMSGPSLYQHIWEDKGGDSLIFLKRILATKSKRVSFSNDILLSADIASLLKTYGPALVSGFTVTSDFNSSQWSHLGTYENDDYIGRHAMVLIGSRQVEGKTYYLLQNWWTKKAYVEVDPEYLLSSEANIHFIKDKQLKMGDFPTSFEQLVECEIGLDASENFLPES